MTAKKYFIVGGIIIFILGLAFTYHASEAACVPSPTAGDDDIVCSGSGITVSLSADAGNDTVTLNDTYRITGLKTDDFSGVHGDDAVIINDNARVTSINLDPDNDGNGDDIVTINGSGRVTGINGDSTSGDGYGNDTVIINDNGRVTGFNGDSLFGAGYGDDTLIINDNGRITGFYGDTSSGDGYGNDTLIVNDNGWINGFLGDSAFSNGYGNDTVIINGNGTVDKVHGDSVYGTGYGNDTIIINDNGMAGVIYGDSQYGTGTGNDTVINAGTIGDAYLNGGNDVVILLQGGRVLGILDGGPDFDTLVFDMTADNYEDQQAFAQLIQAANPSGGSITIFGLTYTWTNFEELLNLIQLRPFCMYNLTYAYQSDADRFEVWGTADAENGFLIADFAPSTLTQDVNGVRFQDGYTEWYVVVYWVTDHYQINIYTPWDALVNDRCTFG